MNAPLYKFGLFGDHVGLLIGFLIGVGFGFFLERAGFGSGNKLARQFYFKDMAVLKVMFSAIITAMVGVFWLSRVGFMDLSQVYLVPTHLGPQIAGGLMLGGGFVIGGYCPGTSVVAAATGRIDAWIYMVGMFAGMLAVGFFMPGLGDFMASGDLGQTTLSSSWNIPYGLLVAGVVLMAFGAFLAAEWGEVKSGGRTREDQSLLWHRGYSRPRLFVGGAVVLGVGAAMAGTPYRGAELRTSAAELTRIVSREADHIAPRALAERLVEGTQVPRIVDLQLSEEYAAFHLPGAENIPMTDLPTASFTASEPVLLYAADEAQAAQAWVLLKSRGYPAVYTLGGGLAAWKSDVLSPQLPAAPVGDALDEARARAALARHFGGQPRGLVDAAPPVVPAAPAMAAPATGSTPDAAAPAAAPKKAKKKEGC
jgi:rhodanese-related sulfurtransferase